MRKILICASAAGLIIFGGLQAAASGRGFIEGGPIYTASGSSSTVTFRVSIANPGSAALHGVTVTATEPTHGTSTVKVCASDAAPRCTDDTASVGLDSGQTLTYRSGSLSGASGNIFTGASVGTVQPGLSHKHYVTFTMTRHNPAPAPTPAPVHLKQTPVNNPSPAPVHNQQPVHHHAAQAQPQHAQQNDQTETIVEPPVTVTVPGNSTEAAATTPQTDNSDLGTAGIGNPLVPFFAGALAVGAFALRRSRQRLVGAILER